MSGDLISRKALVKAILEERDKIPLTTKTRYELGTENPNRHGQSMRGGIRKALRCVEEATAVDAVELPEGKPGDYVEWDNGCGVCSLYCIRHVMFGKNDVRYDLGEFCPTINHLSIKQILTREEAEAALRKEKENEVDRRR